MYISKQKCINLFLMTLAVVFAYVLAEYQIQPLNEYNGMQPIKYDLSFFFVGFSFLVIWSVFFPTYRESPVTIFFSVYILFNLIWFAFFYSVSGYGSLSHVFLNVIILLLPFTLIFYFKDRSHFLFNTLFGKINIQISIGKIEYLIVTILFVVSILTYKKMGISFSFVESYTRRLLAREQVGGMLAYLLPMCLNGLAPTLAFLSTVRRKYPFFALAFLFVILGFGFVGTKAPIGLVFLLGFLGLYIRKFKSTVASLLSKIILAFIFLAFIEYLIFEFSWMADIVIRRAFLLPSQIQGYFINHFFAEGNFELWLTGFSQGKAITYIIGERYFGNEEINANTHAFLYEIGRSGLFGYALAVTFVTFFFLFLEYMYSKSKDAIWLGIAFLYSILLVEQAYSTAFVTSGIGLVIILIFITNSGGLPSKHDSNY